MKNNRILVSDLMRDSGVGFGTSGARGRVVDMTDRVCFAYTTAFLQYLVESGQCDAGCAVAIAGDLRPSTPRIMNAVAAAAAALGHRVVNCGPLPSPAVALYGLQEHIPAIMVTGSHIPDDRNGIKFNSPQGEILKADEQAISAREVSLPEDAFDNEGGLREPGNESGNVPGDWLGEVSSEAEQRYLQRYLQALPENALQGLRVGLYQHSGVARDLLKTLLDALGAETVCLGRSDTFIPVDTEAIREEDQRLAKQWAREHGLDAIVSTDGDADRPLVGDETGDWLRGDVSGVLCARWLGVAHVVTPVSSNTVVEKSGFFQSVTRTRIGSPYVIEAMQQQAASQDGSLANEGAAPVAGYEANGGFLLQTPARAGGAGRGRLEALPTRDAVIVILALLCQAAESKQPLSELVKQLPPRFTCSDRLKAFPTERSAAILQELYADEGDFSRIEAVFSPLCGKVSAVDTTDGLRISFENQEIVHLRPSGNAPEFRCYNEADSETRARQLNRECMAILEGMREKSWQ